MTDTIDVAALVERLRHLVALNEPQNGGPYQGYAAQQFIEAASEAATALQSQADALAEARRETPVVWGHYYADIIAKELAGNANAEHIEEARAEHMDAAKAATFGSLEDRLGGTGWSSNTRSPVDLLRDAVEAAGGTVAYTPGGFVVHFAEILTRATTAEASLATMREALEPFASFALNNTDDDGWAGTQCQRERIVDWFGPSDFIAARRALGGSNAE